MDTNKIKNSDFSQVDISYFFNNDENIKNEIIQTGIIVFTDYQQKLIKKLQDALEKTAPDRLARLQERLDDVTSLAQAIARFPSLLERANTTTSTEPYRSSTVRNAISSPFLVVFFVISVSSPPIV